MESRAGFFRGSHGSDLFAPEAGEGTAKRRENVFHHQGWSPGVNYKGSIFFGRGKSNLMPKWYGSIF